MRVVPRSEVALTDQTSAAANACGVAAKQVRRDADVATSSGQRPAPFRFSAMLQVSTALRDPVCRAAAVPGWLQKCQRPDGPAESPISTLTALGEVMFDHPHRRTGGERRGMLQPCLIEEPVEFGECAVNA